MLQATIRTITTVSLLAALCLSAAWWFRPEQWWLEPASTLLALTSVASGIPAEHWAAAAQRRQRVLAALRRELAQNAPFFHHKAFDPVNQGPGQVYPRLKLAAVDLAFLGDVLDGARDENLRTMLLLWRNSAEDLNRRLDITEVRLATVEFLKPEERAVLARFTADPAGIFLVACENLTRLRQLLVDEERRRVHRYRHVYKLARWLRLPGEALERGDQAQ